MFRPVRPLFLGLWPGRGYAPGSSGVRQCRGLLSPGVSAQGESLGLWLGLSLGLWLGRGDSPVPGLW